MQRAAVSQEALCAEHGGIAAGALIRALLLRPELFEVRRSAYACRGTGRASHGLRGTRVHRPPFGRVRSLEELPST